MADDKEVAVKLSADVKSFLQGMKDAQEHTETAVAGMKGDLGSAVESFEKFGAGALAVGMVGLAFEALKESMGFIKESINETNELARTYKDLAFQTGESFENLNKMNTAQQLTGGTVQELETWMKGATRAIKTNADMLVENGIAASKAELMAMPFTEYLKKVMAAAESIDNPLRRGIFLQESLGRAGMQAAPQIREMLEQLENAPEILARYGRSLGEDNVQQMERAEHATGKLTIATRGLKQTLAEVFGDSLSQATAEMAVFVAELNRAVPFLEAQARMTQALVQSSPLGIARRMISSGWDSSKEEVKGGPDWGDEAPKGPEKHIKTKEELDEEKKAAEERRAMRKAVDEDIIRSAAATVAEQMKDDKELLASGQMTYAELVGDMKNAYKAQLDTAAKALKDEEKLAAGKPAELQAIHLKEKELTQKYYADLHELDRQAAENTRKEKAQAEADAEKMRKQNLDLARIAARDELDIQKVTLAAKEQALDDDLNQGRISLAQWVALKQAAAMAGLRADLNALDKEQAAARDDLVKWRTIQAQKDALNRKTATDMANINRTASQQTAAFWDQAATKATNGWANGIQKILHNEMSFTQGMGSALKQIEDQTEKSLINMGLYWVKHFLLRTALQEDAHMKEVLVNAKGAAAGAYNAMVGIPYIGPFIAPVAAAVAFAGTMAFAEGGWDQVPSDQVTMLHKNEMVLPAWAANPFRESLKSGGGFAGAMAGGSSQRPISITIQAMDGQDVHRTLTKHQDSLFRVLREGGKNRRL